MYLIYEAETSTQKFLTKQRGLFLMNGASHMAQHAHVIPWDGASYVAQQKKAMKCPAGIISVGGRLKLQIWYHLLSGTKRFGELQRLVPWASRQMLTMQLRDLERLGVLQRRVYEQMPPKVEYTLTEHGRSAEPMLRQLNTWAEQAGIGF
jgi:DNA-binding HxlR family transcriptional regulator